MKSNKYKIQLYSIPILVLLRLIFGSLAIILGFQYLHNHKFHVDALKIYKIYQELNINDIFKFEPFNSFYNTARLYKILFFNMQINFEWFVFLTSILYLLLFICIISNIEVKYNKKIFVIFSSFFIFDMIFLFQPSKEFFSLLVNLIFFKYVIKHDRIKSKVFALIIYSLYAYYFRKYYFIIIIIYFGIQIFIKFKISSKVVCILIFTSVFIYMFNNTNYLDEIVFIRNQFIGLAENTATYIGDICKHSRENKSILLFFINYFINFIRIVFPIEVLWKSTSRGIIFFPIQIYITYLVIKYINFILNNRKVILYISDKELVEKFNIIKRSISYILSFFLVGALFEPDFGSVFRHSMNLLPIILYLIFSINKQSFTFNIENNKEI
jgi:hypothetical protein